jgi:hypothetical protein
MRGWGICPAVLVALCVFHTGSALACSCAPQPPAESLREADGAIVGRLVRVLPHGALNAVFRYEVRHVYKGADSIDEGQMLDVRGARRTAACGLPRRAERSYGLFLSLRNGRWFGGICGVVSPRRLRGAAQNQAAASARAPVQPVLCG